MNIFIIQNGKKFNPNSEVFNLETHLKDAESLANMLAAIIDNTDQVIWCVNKDNRMIVFNKHVPKRLKAIWGIDVAVGQVVEELLPKEDAELLKSLYSAARRKGSVRLEYEYEVNIDGKVSKQVTDVWMNALPETGEVAVMTRNITERKRMEREKENLIAELQEALSKVKKLEEMLEVCAWSGKVKRGERWIEMEQFLREQFGVSISHGISPEKADELRREWEKTMRNAKA